MTDRKQFIRLSYLGLGALMIPDLLLARPPAPFKFLVQESDTSTKTFAESALKFAHEKGASYADVRIANGNQQGQDIMGIRVLVNGKWGYASIAGITDPAIITGVEKAVMNATEKQRYQYNLRRPHRLWKCSGLR
jgi:TldD protein